VAVGENTDSRVYEKVSRSKTASQITNRIVKLKLMCGIVGFISKEKNSPAKEREILLDKMCKIITYRGPDEQGTVVKDRAALGMRRLSIIDIKSGQQPIYSEDGNLAIVFNGEIYNFQELKKELESIGHSFKTHSDTETILHAFEEFGPNCLEKLRGMFAFAIWNFRDETLFIARDRVGKKPLFYCLTKNGNFVFGSELKTLLAHGEIEKEIDFAALDSYLTFGYVPEEFCIFKNVQKLAPAHFLIFKNGKVQAEKYWDFNYKQATNIKSEDEYIEVLREKIKDAVNIRLISEVPLGAFLSGGVDSSTIVAMMSQISTMPVKTFSIGFNEDNYDELKYARVAAKHFGTEHHEFIVTPDLVDLVDELVWHFDEPFSDSSALPTYMVSKMAREFVTVVLSGDGGDELFAGYTRYVIDKKRSNFANLPKAIRKGVLQSISEKLPHAARGKNYLYNVSLDPIDRYIDSLAHFNAPRKRSLYSRDFQAKLNGAFGAGERVFQAFAESVSTENTIDKLLYLDSKTYLPSDILTKVDRMSMANSLEARAPLLDHKLIEFVVNIPPMLKMKGLETKYILKKAMEGNVPHEILYREKQGFGVPISDWINAQLRERMHADLSDRQTLERGYFEKSYIQTLLDEHSESRRDHSHQLWLLWMLELWHRRFIDN
jgi:asparagine synthase (glutamine-hydrolysing)